jgi:hypothetical protein
MGLWGGGLARDRRLCAGVFLDRDGRFFIDGAKLRAEFVVPHAQDRSFFCGINFELSFNARYCERTRNSGEIRPIIGGRIGPVDLIVNPILDTSFQGVGSLDFAPASRVAYNFSEIWTVVLEHYADYGRLNHFEPLNRQQQTLFAVIDYMGDPVAVEFGIGHGFTAASDAFSPQDDLVARLLSLFRCGLSIMSEKTGQAGLYDVSFMGENRSRETVSSHREGSWHPYSRPGASNRGFDSLNILIAGDQGVEWPPQSLRGFCPGPRQLSME